MRVEANTAKKIADLFNAIRVWTDIANEELEAGNFEKYERLIADVEDHVLELADVYGIELPELELVRKAWVRRAA